MQSAAKTYTLTIQEAREWMKFKTGQDWSLHRLIGEGAALAVWFEPNPEFPELFKSTPAGFATPVIDGSDLQRLAFTRDSGTLTFITHPTHGIMRSDPPARFDAEAVRFSVESLEAIVAYRYSANREDGNTCPPLQVEPEAKPKATRGQNKSAKTIAFEKRVHELMSTHWNKCRKDKKNKNMFYQAVYDDLLREQVRGARGMTLSMVIDAAKKWKAPILVRSGLSGRSSSNAPTGRHQWKGDR